MSPVSGIGSGAQRVNLCHESVPDFVKTETRNESGHRNFFKHSTLKIVLYLVIYAHIWISILTNLLIFTKLYVQIST